MLETSTTLVLAGALCLFLSGYAMYILTPRPGREPSALTKTEFRATSTVMFLLVLMLAGVGMLAKGIF